MADTDSMLKCSVGGSAFRLVDYAYSEKPMLGEVGRMGTEITLSGKGEISAATQTLLSAAIATLLAAMRTSGQDWTITALGGVTEIQVLSAMCLDGGPHCSVDLVENLDGASLVRNVEFELTAKTTVDGSAQGTGSGEKNSNAYNQTTKETPDDLRNVTIRGQIAGPASRTYFDTTVVPFFDGKFAANKWVKKEVSYQAKPADDFADYQIVYGELVEVFPLAGGIGQIVDGEATQTKERDEQGRLVRRVTFDFLLDGPNADQVMNKMRAMLLPAVAIRERYAVTTHQEIRLQGELEVLAAANADNCLGWEQSLAIKTAAQAWEAMNFPGVYTLLISTDPQPMLIVQSGSAVGLQKWVKEPAPIWPDNLHEQPDIAFECANDFEWTTRWRYSYLFPGDELPTIDAALRARLKRPLKVSFYDEGAGQ